MIASGPLFSLFFTKNHVHGLIPSSMLFLWQPSHSGHQYIQLLWGSVTKQPMKTRYNLQQFSKSAAFSSWGSMGVSEVLLTAFFNRFLLQHLLITRGYRDLWPMAGAASGLQAAARGGKRLPTIILLVDGQRGHRCIGLEDVNECPLVILEPTVAGASFILK